MKKYWNKLAFAAVALLSIGFAACGDDETQPDEWNANYVSLVPEHLGLATYTVTLGHNGDGISGPAAETQFTAALKRAASTDVTLELDTKLSENLPADKIKFSHMSVTIPAGELISEPVSISIPNWDFQATNKLAAEFLATVTVKSVQGKDVQLSRQNQVALRVVKNALQNLAAGTPSTGALITDRSVWKITVQPGVENADNPGVLVDGKSTDVAVNSGVFWITIDLTKETNVTGIRTASFGSNYAPRGIKVSISNNGTDWFPQGELATSGTTQNTKFIAPQTCRYIKYEITKGSNNGRLDITEFNVYAK